MSYSAPDLAGSPAPKVYSASGIKSTGAEVNTASGIKSEDRKTRRKKNEITGIREGLFSILEADHPQTVRQVYYAMTVLKLVEKTEQEYDGTVGRLLGDMREGETFRSSGSPTTPDGSAAPSPIPA